MRVVMPGARWGEGPSHHLPSDYRNMKSTEMSNKNDNCNYNNDCLSLSVWEQRCGRQMGWGWEGDHHLPLPRDHRNSQLKWVIAGRIAIITTRVCVTGCVRATLWPPDGVGGAWHLRGAGGAAAQQCTANPGYGRWPRDPLARRVSLRMWIRDYYHRLITQCRWGWVWRCFWRPEWCYWFHVDGWLVVPVKGCRTRGELRMGWVPAVLICLFWERRDPGVR